MKEERQALENDDKCLGCESCCEVCEESVMGFVDLRPDLSATARSFLRDRFQNVLKNPFLEDPRMALNETFLTEVSIFVLREQDSPNFIFVVARMVHPPRKEFFTQDRWIRWALLPLFRLPFPSKHAPWTP